MSDFKRFRDIDVAFRSHFIRVYCWLFFPLLFIMLFVPVGFWAKIGITLAGTLAGTLAVVFITSAAGSSAGTLYSGGGARLTLREQLEGELTRARVSKTNRDFEDALATLETVLAQDPDSPDALLLKAQVLWEGFADGPEALKCALKILHLEKDKSSPVYRWAGELYKEINRGKAPVK